MLTPVPDILYLVEDLFLFLNNPISKQQTIPIPYAKFLPSIIEEIRHHVEHLKQTHIILQNSPKAVYYLRDIKHKLNELPAQFNADSTIFHELRILIDMLPISSSTPSTNFRIPNYTKLLNASAPIIPMPSFTNMPISGFISTSFLGNLSYKYGNPKEVYTLRQRLVKTLGIEPKRIISFGLANGNRVINLNEFQKRYPNYMGMIYVDPHIEKTLFADALVFDTNTKEYGAFFLVGDCSLVLLYDTNTQIWALAHVGKNAITTDLLGNTIGRLVHLGVKPENLQVILGPTIYKYSYQYNSSILELKDHPHWKGSILKMDDGLYTPNLIGAIRSRLIELGVKYDNILITPIDTFSSPLLFSHQRSHRLKLPEQRFGVLVAPKQLFETIDS